MRYADDASVDSDLCELRGVSDELDRTRKASREAAEGLIRRAISREVIVTSHPSGAETLVEIECSGTKFRFPIPMRDGFAAEMEPTQREIAFALLGVDGIDDSDEQNKLLDNHFTVLCSAIELLQRSIANSFEMRFKPSGRRPSTSAITFRGETGSIAFWARKSGLKESVIRSRLNKGWKPEEIFGTRATDPTGAGARGKAASPWGLLQVNLERREPPAAGGGPRKH